MEFSVDLGLIDFWIGIRGSPAAVTFQK